MSRLSENAGIKMKEAVAAETSGNLPVALNAYIDATTLLKSALQFEQMLPEQKTRLTQYIHQVDGKISHLRSIGVVLPQQQQQQQPAPQSTASGTSSTSSTTTAGGQKPNIALPQRGTFAPRPVLPSSTTRPASTSPTPAEGEKKTSPPPEPSKPPATSSAPKPKVSSDGPGPSPFVGASNSTAGASAKKADLPAPSSTSESKDSGDSTPTPTPAVGGGGSTSGGGLDGPHFSPGLTDAIGNKYAPRASTLVLNALERATVLVKNKQLKLAIDMIQHAIDEGGRESHNPANFSKLFDTMKDLKLRYQRDFPPRWLQTNQPTPSELEVLRRSGRTDRMLLPIWDDVDEGYATENVHLPCKPPALWEDSWMPALEPKQKEKKPKWGRPAQWALEAGGDAPVVLKDVDPMSIRQTLVGDCSLVCSLIVCASYQKRFPNGNILGRVIFPQDHEGNPIVSKMGKYCVKMLVNGVTRMIAIDDRLPYVETERGGKALLCTFSKDPKELWVSLMEKAFIKVCGGSYDFPGSQSSSDLYKLCGWLPDLLAFDSEKFDANLQWVRLSACHKTGKVLTTISTPSSLPKVVEEKLKLVEGHAYAVLEFKECQGHRLLKIKNPWAKQSWQGLFSVNDEDRCTDEMKAELGFSEEESAQGVFWMSWQDVCKFFSRAHLSWNPYLLFPGPNGAATKPTRIACHSTFVYNEGFGALPQFHLQTNSPNKGRLHLVLSRHIRSSAEFSINSDVGGRTLVPFISMYIFDITQYWSAMKTVKPNPPNCSGPKDGRARRIYNGGELPKECCVHKGVYKNLPNQTVSFDCPQGITDFVVVVSEHNPADKNQSTWNFTLTLHTNLPLGPQGAIMYEVPQATLPFATKKECGWKKGATCGGPYGKQTWGFNPQFKFSLPQPAHVTARLQSKIDDSINIHLIRHSDSSPLGAQALATLAAASGGGEAKPPPKQLMLPWQGRAWNLNTKDHSLIGEFIYYTKGCVVVDSSIAKCFRYNAHSTKTASSPQPAAPQPSAAANQGKGPSHLTQILIKVPKANCELPATVDIDAKVEEVFTLLMGSQRYLASSGVSKVICNKAQVEDPSNTTFGMLKAQAEQESPAASTSTMQTVVLLNTEDMPRSQELGKIEATMMDLAKQILPQRSESMFKKENGEGRGVPPAEKREKMLKGINEGLMKIQLDLDKAHCPTDAIKATRKAIVISSQVLQKSVDFLLKPLPPVGGAGGGSSPTASGAPTTSADVSKFFGERLPAGEYTIVASTWTKGKPGAFDLIFESESEQAVQSLEQIPEEGDGYTCTTITGSWTADNNVGKFSPNSVNLNDRFHSNPFVEIKLPRKGILSARLLSMPPNAAAGSGDDKEDEPSTHIMVFQPAGGGSQLELVTASGQYESVTGLSGIELNQGVKYRLVLSTTQPGQLPFVIKLWTSCDPELCELRNTVAK